MEFIFLFLMNILCCERCRGLARHWITRASRAQFALCTVFTPTLHKISESKGRSIFQGCAAS